MMNFRSLRRLAATSTCWSGCALAAFLLIVPASAADRFPKPKFTWSRPAKESPELDQAAPKAESGGSSEKALDDVPAAAAGGFTDTLNVKLSFLSSEWTKVLEDVAEKSGSTLVMMDTPPGRFSRRDNKRYSRTQAVQILNRELEPLGYRILEKDNFLTVLEIHRLRVEYPRGKLLGADGDVAAQTQLPPQMPPQRMAGHSIQPPAAVRQVVHQTLEQASPAEAQAPAAEPPAPPIVDQKFLPENRSAIDLAKHIHAAFQARSTLVDSGQSGLPGFQVRAAAPSDSLTPGKMLFEVELNETDDELVIHGTASVVQNVTKLLKRLDRPQNGDPANTVEFIPGDERTAAAADQVRPMLTRLAQFREGARGTGQAREEEQPNAEGSPEGAQANGANANGVIDEVQGEVTIEYVEGVGLVLVGNESDIEAVLRVINSVEAMAVGSMPDIQLLLLQHVDSEALAPLLTNVYTELSTVRNRGGQTQAPTKQVSILPVGTPNAILIIAPQEMMKSVVDLATELDKPVDPQSQLNVFRLKYAVASQVVTHLTTMYPSSDTTGFGATTTTTTGLQTRYRAIADIRTNTVIIQARPRDLSEIEKLIEELDTDASGSVLQTQRIQLRNAVSDELQQFLMRAIQGVLNPAPMIQQQTGGQFGGGGFGGGGFGGAGGTTQAPQELRDSKAVVLEFLQNDANATRLIRSGLLSDIRIQSEPRTNSLLISAPEQSMALVLGLIDVLDTPSAFVADLKVFTLNNADAVAMADQLTQMFSPQTTGNGAGGAQGQGAQGVQITGASDSSSMLVPMRFSADARTNQIVAMGGPEALRVAEAIIYRLDSADSRNRKTEVIRLRNTPAEDIAAALQTYLQQITALAQIDPERITTNQLLLQQVIVQAVPVSNNLLISATPRYIDDMVRIAMNLDREPPQVMIQAQIVEVTLSNDTEFGIELGFQDSLLFDRSVTGIPGFLFNNSPLGNNTAVHPAGVGSQGLSSFALGRTSSELGFGGLVLSASSESVSVLMRALAASSNAKVLSRPSVLALDNQIAEITVGQTVPRSQGVTITNNIVSPQVADTDVGIILSVIPRITPEGKVIMDVIANKSALSGQSVVIFADATTGNTVESPIINRTRATTSVKVQDGQTIVVGGMITSTDSSTTRKVPWLGDLPVVGHAFRYDQNRQDRTELLIFLTPRIVTNECDAEVIKQIETERLHFFEQDAEEMHGPLFGLPERRQYPSGLSYPIISQELPGGAKNAFPLPGGVKVPPGSFPVPDQQSNLPTAPGSVPQGFDPNNPSAMPVDGQGMLMPGPGSAGNCPDPYCEGTPSFGGPVIHPPPIDPPTNSRRVQEVYGGWYGREPLAH